MFEIAEIQGCLDEGQFGAQRKSVKVLLLDTVKYKIQILRQTLGCFGLQLHRS